MRVLRGNVGESRAEQGQQWATSERREGANGGKQSGDIVSKGRFGAVGPNRATGPNNQLSLLTESRFGRLGRLSLHRTMTRIHFRQNLSYPQDLLGVNGNVRSLT